MMLLTARGEESDRVVGLKLGADDYVMKPFSPAELVARVGAVLRPLAGPPADGERSRFGDVSWTAARTCRRGGARRADGAGVRPAAHLARNPGRAFSRDELMHAVWRYAYCSNTATVTVHVRRLRQKIEATRCTRGTS